MPLRSVNDPVDATGILNAVAAVIVPNTQFQAGGGTIYINNWATLNGPNATYPALVLESGQQVSRRAAWKTWQSSLVVSAQYLDMWETQPNGLDAIWANLDLDLHRMKANIEDNPTLKVNGVVNSLNISDFHMSPYIGQREDRTGFSVIKRTLRFTVHTPLYVSGL